MTNTEIYNAFEMFSLKRNFKVSILTDETDDVCTIKFEPPRGNYGYPTIFAKVDTKANTCIYSFRFSNLKEMLKDGLDAFETHIGMIQQFIVPDITKILKETFKGIEIKRH